MRDITYIFGYQSILSGGSMSVNVHHAGSEPAWMAARLMGWRRDWSAVRRFSDHPVKRYVRLPDWEPVEQATFANLRPDPRAWVNGVLRPVAAEQLPALDFRESGYRRVRVNDQIKPYPGFALPPGVACEAYVDDKPQAGPAPVSQAYYDMGRLGAQRLDEQIPGFASNYLQTTPVPEMLSADMRFVFFSRDARHVWLLQESDSSLVLLLKLAQPQFDGGVSPDARPAELDRPISAAGREWDWRHRGAQHEGVLRDHPAAWLNRLAQTQSEQVDAGLLERLASDQDAWVRRAAIIRLGKNT